MGHKRPQSSIHDSIFTCLGEKERNTATAQSDGDDGTTVSAGGRRPVFEVLDALKNAGLCTLGRDLVTKENPYQVRGVANPKMWGEEWVFVVAQYALSPLSCPGGREPFEGTGHSKRGGPGHS